MREEAGVERKKKSEKNQKKKFESTPPARPFALVAPSPAQDAVHRVTI